MTLPSASSQPSPPSSDRGQPPTTPSATADTTTPGLGYKPFEYWKGPKPVYPKPGRPPSTALNTIIANRAKRISGGIQSLLQELPSKGDKVVGPRVTVTEMAHYGREAKGANAGFVAHSTGPSSFQVRDLNRGGNNQIELVSSEVPPPPYTPTTQALRGGGIANGAQYGSPRSKWNPKTWGKKAWAIAFVVFAILIIVIVVPSVVVTRNNRYPDYTKLDYSLKDTYSGTSFFDNFDYFTGYDPTSGFVHYVPEAQATSLNLTYASSTAATLKVDTSVGPSSTPDASTGRFSVRLTSKTQYEDGLFIFDVNHTPYGCGTWPALWLTDPNNWPTNGEIDVMESVNNATDGNQMTLHTTDNCDMSVKRKMTGTSLTTNCYNGTDDNSGCGVMGNTTSYGEAFNQLGGGVMAMELRDEGIRMWQFMRGSIPSDISSGSSPDPSGWGEALADFPNTDCDIASHFKNQSIVVNIDLCGTWAGSTSVYGESGCPSTCTDYVANNPTAFTNAYWEFSSFKIYQASSSSSKRRWFF